MSFKPEEGTWEAIAKLFKSQATMGEVADLFVTNESTLNNYAKEELGMSIWEYQRKHAAVGKTIVRAITLALAEQPGRAQHIMVKYFDQKYLGGPLDSTQIGVNIQVNNLQTGDAETIQLLREVLGRPAPVLIEGSDDDENA